MKVDLNGTLNPYMLKPQNIRHAPQLDNTQEITKRYELSADFQLIKTESLHYYLSQAAV